MKQDRKRILEHLQDSALIQVKSSGKKAQEGFRRKDTASQLKQFERNAELTQQALHILSRLSPEKKGMLSSFKGRKEIDPDEIGRIAADSAKIISVCQKICQLDKQRADYAAEQVRIRTSLAQLEPWRQLDIPLNTKDTPTTAVLIGTLPKAYDNVQLSEALAKECPELIFEYEILYTSPNMTCLTLFTPKKQRESAEKALRTIGFSQPLNPTSRTPMVKMQRQQQKSEEIAQKDEAAKEEIISLAKYRESICETEDYFILRSEKYKVLSQLDQTNHVFVLYGYVPEEDCKALEALCQKASPSCVVDFGEADKQQICRTCAKHRDDVFDSCERRHRPDADLSVFLLFLLWHDVLGCRLRSSDDPCNRACNQDLQTRQTDEKQLETLPVLRCCHRVLGTCLRQYLR